MSLVLFSQFLPLRLPFGNNPVIDDREIEKDEAEILNVYFSLIGARQYEATVDGSAICERQKERKMDGSIDDARVRSSSASIVASVLLYSDIQMMIAYYYY